MSNIYGIADPRDATLHHIVDAQSDGDAQEHIVLDARRITKMGAWIKELNKTKQQPEIFVIESDVNGTNDLRFWRQYFTAIGAELFNDGRCNEDAIAIAA